MFSRFAKYFREDAITSGIEKGVPEIGSSDNHLRELWSRYGGRSFNKGLYRIVDFDSHALGHSFISQAFPEFSKQGQPFGFDWLGRVFALDSSRKVAGASAVLMFEPGTGEALEVPCNLLGFHEQLFDLGEEALAAGFNTKWLSAGGAAPSFTQCVGYKRPLFLGGADELSNLEICDLDVYWTLGAQLISQTRALPPGTVIKGVASGS